MSVSDEQLTEGRGLSILRRALMSFFVKWIVRDLDPVTCVASASFERVFLDLKDE